MTYRVTNSMMQSLMLNDMHSNLNKLIDIQQQLSTQRKYQHASENPHAVTKGMGLETQMTETEQYISNLQDAISWLKFTDEALSEMNDYFTRIRELAVEAGQGSLEAVDRTAIAEELRQIKAALMEIANSTIGGEYLFSGLKTDTVPFALGLNGDTVYNGNDYALFWEFARQATGKVSLTGREVFPLDETTNRLKGIEVPMDFEWTGRSEILEFKVGNKTVKVRIPEAWTDEIANGLTDTSDYNRYRDPGEPLEGWSLDDIANMINTSTEMGDASKLIKATVVKDLDRGVQYLQIQSLTGETVRLTSWPETDPIAVAQGIQGAAYGQMNRVASSDGTITIRFGDNQLYTVDVEKGEKLEDIATKLNSLPDGRIWAAYKNDGTNEWIDITGRDPDDYYSITTTGGATQFFATQSVTANSVKSGSDQAVTSKAYDTVLTTFSSLSDGKLVIREGVDTYEIAIAAGTKLADIAAAITAAVSAGELPATFSASVNANGALEIKSTGGEYTVTAEGGMVPLYSDGVHVSSAGAADASGNYSADTAPLFDDFELENSTVGNAFSYEFGGKKYWIDMSAWGSPLELSDLAAKLQTQISAIDANATVTLRTGLDDDGRNIQWLHIETTSGPFKLSGFGNVADATDMMTDFVQGSAPIYENSDHTHIGFAAMMQMETSLTSTEIPMANGGTKWDTTQPGNAVHLNFVSGTHHSEVFIADDADLTLEELAARINSVCGDWMQAVVETDSEDGTDSIIDPLNNSGDNEEKATQRLILRTLDGAALAVYDGLGKSGVEAGSYAALLGIDTALSASNMELWNKSTDTPLSGAGYPSDGAGVFDENMPAILKVTVGDKEFSVKVCKNNRYTGKLVMEAIVDQVNAQYGGTLLAVGKNAYQGSPVTLDVNGNPIEDTYSVYALTGEPLRVVDAGYGDPRFTEFSGGVAMQLGIAAGRTTTEAMTDATTFNAGVIRISTPGHTIDVPVLAGETLQTIANRIRDYAGSWLDVSFYDSDINNSGGAVMMSVAAKDGSAVSVFDVSGDAAWNMGLDTGLVGAVDLLNNFPTITSDDFTLSITVNGATHTIDLWDENYVNAGGTNGKAVVSNVEELAELINTRFQGQDIKAEVLETKDANGNVIMKRLALWSPKGYNFTISGEPSTGGTVLPDALGFSSALGNVTSHGNAGTAGSPFNQTVTHRTGDNQYEIDFFGVMDNLINTVEGGNVDGLSDTILSQLDSWLSTLMKCRSQVGALENRYETATYRMTSNSTNYTDLYTQTVGVDLAEAITDYEMASSIYQASLAAIARLLQPSLLDFLS